MSSCGETVVGEIHRAVGADVALDAGEQRDAFEPLVELSDRARMLERAMLVEPVGHRERLAVIGDGDVLQSPAARAARAIVSTSARPSVAVRVHVEVAAEIGTLDQPRQRSGLGRLDLAAVLPQFRRHERQPQRGIDVPSSSSPATRDVVVERGTARTRSA